MQRVPLLQQRALHRQNLWADGESFSSGSGFASCSAHWWHKVSALLQKQPDALPVSLPLRSIPAVASPWRGTSSCSHRGLAAFGWLAGNRVLVPMLSPSRHPGASQEPVSAPLPGEGVRAARAEATKSQGGQSSGLGVPCPAPRAPNQPLGLNTPEPLKTRSFPSSFTYVNDDPQEVIVGERRELASLDLLNHFITGTRSEWPLSAGSASPSPSAFI